MLKIIRALLLVILVVSASSSSSNPKSRAKKRSFCEIQTEFDEDSQKASPSYQSSAATTTDSQDSRSSFVLEVRPTVSPTESDGSSLSSQSNENEDFTEKPSFDDVEFDLLDEILPEEQGTSTAKALSVEERAETLEFWKMDETDPEQVMISLLMDEPLYSLLNEKLTEFPLWAYQVAVDWKRQGQVKPRELSTAALALRLKAYHLIQNHELWLADEPKLIAQLDELISYGIDLDMPITAEDYSYQGTFLHSALLSAPKDSPKMIEMLIRRGASLEVLDSKNGSPLFIAVRRGHLGSVRVLVDAGAQLNYALPGTNNTSILVVALHYGHFEVFKYLLSLPQLNINSLNGRGYHITAFAVARNLPQYLQAIFDCPRLMLNANQHYALFLQCHHQNSREMFRIVTVNSLRAPGVPPQNLQNFFAGFIRDNLTMGVEEFLAAGFKADFSIKRAANSFISLVHLAAMKNRPEILELLRQHGHDMNILTTEQFTPAVVAISAGSFDAFRYLLPHMNHFGVEQCLKVAVRKGLLQLVDALATAHPQSLRQFRSTNSANLLEYVATFGQTEILNLLTTKYNLKSETVAV